MMTRDIFKSLLAKSYRRVADDIWDDLSRIGAGDHYNKEQWLRRTILSSVSVALLGEINRLGGGKMSDDDL